MCALLSAYNDVHLLVYMEECDFYPQSPERDAQVQVIPYSMGCVSISLSVLLTLTFPAEMSASNSDSKIIVVHSDLHA